MNEERSIFSKYRKIVFAAFLFLIAYAVVIGINFYSTYEAEESAVAINLAGRQRMLSQRMTKALIMADRSLEKGRFVNTRANLRELTMAARLFDTTLKGFREGAMVTGGDGKPVFLPQVKTDESREIVAKTDEVWKYYLELLQPLLSKNDEFSTEELETLLESLKENPDPLIAAAAFGQMNNLKLLDFMVALTNDMEHVANARADTLRLVLAAGILFAVLIFAYTVIVSVRDLIESDRLLEEARKETAEILDTVREGLFLLDKHKRIGTQFSSSLSDILRREIVPGADFLPHLEAIAPKNVYEAAVDYIDLLLGDRVKESLVASLNPLMNVPVLVTDPRGEVNTRYLSFFFNRVVTAEKKVSHLLVTVQDVTDKAVLAQQVEQAKNQAKAEVETLLRLANSDFGSLQNFINHVGESLAQINEKLSTPHEEARERLQSLNYIMRVVHGIKGEAAVLGIDVLEGYAHECEKEMAAMREDETFGGDQLLRVAVLLEGFYQRHSSLAQIISRLGSALGKGQLSEDEDEAEASRRQPFVEQVTALAERIAADHGKQVKVSCRLESMFSLPRNVAKELQDISVQLVRNALTHGIETPDKRSARNKPLTGALSIRCESHGHGRYTFAVRDDGCGIVPERLRKSFVSKNIMSREEAAALSDKEVAALLFQPGVSTAEIVDQDSGHGIGRDVVLDKVRTMGGHMLVRSSPDKFTEFSIQFSMMY